MNNRIAGFGVVSAFVLLTACSGGDVATIKGTFSNVGKKTVYLDYIATNGISPQDSATTDDKGRFRMKVPIVTGTPSFYNLRYGNYTIPLLLSPGEKVEVRSLGNLSRNYLVEGSHDSQLLKELSEQMFHSRAELDSLQQLYVSIGENDEIARRFIISEYNRIFMRQKREMIAFVATNPTSLAAIYALYQKMPNGENIFGDRNDFLYYKQVGDSLTKRFPTSPHVLSLRKDIEQMENVIKLEHMVDQASQSSSATFPDIDLPDMYGQRMKLSSIKGKVILLDFWMAQNAQSRLLNAELLEVYKKYASRGFEVYQVSLDESKPMWINTVQDQRLPWISVCDFNGVNSPAARSYGITSLPANVLIDRDGRIVTRNITLDSLEERLGDMF
ncbi:MAG: AhpC/TSA family protein [Rikenellaceae bacterium]|jgi:peroxiredoxin|nr:AhpC/TSA family protein [Rikenellaceae bacterium]